MIIIDLSFTQQKGGLNEENVMWNIIPLSAGSWSMYRSKV